MKNLITLGLIITLSAVSQGQAPVCTSHFNNRSNYDWTLFNFDGRKTWLKVPPNSIVDVPWGSTTSVTLSANIPNRVYLKELQVTTSGACVLLSSTKPLVLVTVNTPAQADIVTCVGNC